MNSNLFHNLVNVATLVLAGVTAALLASGCVEVEGSLSCEASFISPELSAIIITVLMVLKLGVNIIRDGIKGLAKKQPPVE